MSGLIADSKTLIDKARVEAQVSQILHLKYRITFQDDSTECLEPLV